MEQSSLRVGGQGIGATFISGQAVMGSPRLAGAGARFTDQGGPLVG